MIGMSSPLKLLIGHLIGDCLLQSRDMAENKGEKEGFWWSILHGVLYTMAVCTLLWNFHPQTVILIFLSHWPIDRFGVASWWCRNVLDRDPGDVYKFANRFREIRVGFACLHYAIVDNTMHLILMLAFWQFGLI